MINDDTKLDLKAEEYSETMRWVLGLRYCSYDQPNMSIDSFELLSVIGRGYYGKVMLARKKDNGELFAIKTIQKRRLIDAQKVHTVINEKSVLMHSHHPFIVQLFYAFQTSSKFYLVLEYAPGGELFFHMQQRKIPVEDARIYIAEIACALDYLHSQGIIYRDLKPENVLLDANGHAKLTDFGLAKDLQSENTSTFCGTNEYLAPEIICHEKYGFAIDWWALGILFYEMMFGFPPFYHNNRNMMFRRIVEEPVSFPQKSDRKVASLIMGLLVKNPNQRYSFQMIKKHSLFAGIDWDDLLKQKIGPKFIPEVKEPTSTGNFDEEFTEEIPADSFAIPIDGPIGNVEDFSFVRSLNSENQMFQDEDEDNNSGMQFGGWQGNE